MNITITRQLGEAIKRLQAGWRINKVKRGRYSSVRFFFISRGESDLTTEALVDVLIKNKLIEPCGVMEFTRVTHARKAWKATQACLSLRLPPESFWVEDPQ
jgi:hypothetical protein